MKTNIKKIIIVLVVIVLAFVAYQYFFAKETPAKPTTALSSSKTTSSANNTTSPSTAKAPAVKKDTDFLSTLLNISKIKVDGTIFSSPSFNSLQDNNVPIVNNQTVGRPNPFAPFEEASVEITNSVPVTTVEASLVTTNSATLSGAISSGVKAQTRYFEWGTSELKLDKQIIVADQSMVGTFTKNLTGLAPKTTYYYRAVISIGTNKIPGEIMSFTTN